MLQIKNVSLVIQDGKKERYILKNINLSAQPGDMIIIIGANGAGKSTLFKIISGIINSYEGSINIDNIDNIVPIERAKYISYVMQNYQSSTICDMTIFENMNVAYMRGKTRGLNFFANQKRLTYFQEAFKIVDPYLSKNMENIYVRDLSGGQRQSLSLVMATLSDFKILLLDEITSALDINNADIVMRLLHKTLEKNQTKISMMITHNLHDALNIGNRLIIIGNKQIMFDFNSAEKKKLTYEDLIYKISN